MNISLTEMKGLAFNSRYKNDDKDWGAMRAFSSTFAFGKPKGWSGNNNTVRQEDCQHRLSGGSMDSIFVVLSSFSGCVQ